jgi:hypothetical protein
MRSTCVRFARSLPISRATDHKLLLRRSFCDFTQVIRLFPSLDPLKPSFPVERCILTDEVLRSGPAQLSSSPYSEEALH